MRVPAKYSARWIAVAASVLMGELHADNGRFAEAEEAFKRAVALDPDSAEGWAGMAHLRKMTAGDSSWLAQAQRVAERRLPPRFQNSAVDYGQLRGIA
jgi:Flp pilus assembly protein TadD